MNEPMKLEEIGKRLGLTRERVRQIEAGALRKLRVGAQLGEMLSSKLHAALMRELSCRGEGGEIATGDDGEKVRPMTPLEWEAVLVGVEAWQKIALLAEQDRRTPDDLHGKCISGRILEAFVLGATTGMLAAQERGFNPDAKLETGHDQKNAAYSRMCSWLRDSVA